MGEINKYDYYVALITVTATEEAGLKHMYKNWEPLFLDARCTYAFVLCGIHFSRYEWNCSCNRRLYTDLRLICL